MFLQGGFISQKCDLCGEKNNFALTIFFVVCWFVMVVGVVVILHKLV